MFMDFVSIGSFLAFWVVITLAGYWGVARVSKMRAEKGRETFEAQDQVSGDSGNRERVRVHGNRGASQAPLVGGNPVAGQSARDGYSRFQHLSPFRANPR